MAGIETERVAGAGAADEHPGSLTGTVIRGVGLAGGGYVISQALNFISYLVLAKLATPQDFGHFAAGTVVAGLGMVVGESGMLGALIQRRDRLEEAFNAAFLATLGGGVLLTLLALAAAPLIGLFFHSGETGDVAAAMSGWLFLRLSTIVPDARLQRRFSFFRRVIVDPLGVIAFGACAIAAAAAGMGVWALVVGTYASATVNTVAAWALAQWRPRPRLASVGMWRELARFGRPVVLSELVRRVAGEVPVAALGRFAGPGPLGQFSYSNRVATQPLNAIVSAGSYVLLPALARLSSDDRRFTAAFLRALRWFCTIAFPASLIFVPLGMPAVVLVFGHAWRSAGYGAMALAGYCAATSLGSLASEVWKARGRPDMLPRMHLLSLGLTVAFVAAGVPFGLVGVAAGLSVAAVGVGAYAVYGAASVVGLRHRRLLREIWPPALAALIMAGAISALEFGIVHADRHGLVAGLLLLIAEAALAVAIYAAVLTVVARDTVLELTRAVRRRAAPARGVQYHATVTRIGGDGTR